MNQVDIVELLKVTEDMNYKILLTDEQYYIEHNCNYELAKGNGFLHCYAPISPRAPFGNICIGSYDLLINGKWQASINTPYDPQTDSDARSLGEFSNRLDAIAALWVVRHQAYKG